MAPLIRVSGYHGTSKGVADEILRDAFRESANDYDWLGRGVYFFQDAPERAREWARSLHRSEAAVVGARIRLENCLDLLDIRAATFLADAYDSFVRMMKEAGIPLPIQIGGAHQLDRAVIDYTADVLGESGVAVRVVRSAFKEGERIFPNSALFRRSHVQIAVREISLIEETWAEDGGE